MVFFCNGKDAIVISNGKDAVVTSNGRDAVVTLFAETGGCDGFVDRML